MLLVVATFRTGARAICWGIIMALHDENVVWHSHPVTVQQRELHHGHRGVVLNLRPLPVR
ncbi:hypothetical protein ACLK17_16660 [Escherichia coli]